jgi:16S rRNA (cytosine967-C5)-methyltransferase
VTGSPERAGGAVTAPRRVALEVLRAVGRGDLADRALERAAGGLEGRDHAWVLELAYGTLRLRGRLDHLLQALVRGGIEALEPDVLDILRLGAYQITEMGGVPGYAAISQSVDLARIAGAPRAAGLVNGVLRALQRRGRDIRFPELARDPVGHLSSWGSHPRWLVERWVERWGAAAAARLVEADNRRPELFLRPLGLDVAGAVRRLAEAGLDAEPVAFAPDSVRLGEGVGVARALALVPAVVQDPAAALVVRYAAVPEGGTVLDVCAAPGGKALGLAARAGYVAAADVSFRRSLRIRDNAARVGGQDRVGLVVADARHPPFRPADAVLLDAPCTGTGTFRRHPDGRWRLDPAQLRQLVQLQSALLDAAVALVRPGGVLVYSTCSLEPEENELQVRGFLERHPGFVIDAPGEVVEPELLSTPERFLYVLPQNQGVDGSFAARLRRVD